MCVRVWNFRLTLFIYSLAVILNCNLVLLRHSWIISLLFILRCTHECTYYDCTTSTTVRTSVHAAWRNRIIFHNVHNMLQQYGHVSECLQGDATCKNHWLYSLKNGNRRKEGQSRSFSLVTTFFYAVKSVMFSHNAHESHENERGQHVTRSFEFTVQSRPHICLYVYMCAHVHVCTHALQFHLHILAQVTCMHCKWYAL